MRLAEPPLPFDAVGADPGGHGAGRRKFVLELYKLHELEASAEREGPDEKEEDNIGSPAARQGEVVA